MITAADCALLGLPSSSQRVTSRSAALVYQKEPGALNEGASDILGEAAAFYHGTENDWKIGANIYTPGTSGDALRYAYEWAEEGKQLSTSCSATHTYVAAVRSRAYFQAIKDENPFIEVVEQATPELGPLAETLDAFHRAGLRQATVTGKRAQDCEKILRGLGIDREIGQNFAVGAAYTWRKSYDWAYRPRLGGACTGEPSAATCRDSSPTTSSSWTSPRA